MLRFLIAFTLLALLVGINGSSAQEAAQSWGHLKGQIVYAGQGIPAQAPFKAAQAAGIACIAKMPPVDEEYVVDAKTGGLKWVYVLLVDPKNPKNAIPVHPEVAKNLPKKVSFDQPCCTFEPHLLGVVQGQTVEAKNSAPFAHNVNVQGGDLQPNLNPILPPGKSLDIPQPGQEGWKSHHLPVPVTCTIHPWMKMHVRVAPHPYFAVTDAQGNWEIKNAPAGTWNLYIWHEGKGHGPGGKAGVPIVVAADKTTDAGVTKIP
jgi:plastocyanin